MKHPSTCQLFDYWNAQRGSRAMPAREDIDPSAIRSVLADTFILSSEPARGYPFRVAGTRVCALAGHELKGEAFLSLWSKPGRRSIEELIAITVHEALGLVASAVGRGPSGEQQVELLLLPLGSAGGWHTRLLGTLVPNSPGHWVATGTLRDLALGSYRFLGTASQTASCTRQEGRFSRGFLVYDGGQC
jgi:hypothetical protein